MSTGYACVHVPIGPLPVRAKLDVSSNVICYTASISAVVSLLKCVRCHRGSALFNWFYLRHGELW